LNAHSSFSEITTLSIAHATIITLGTEIVSGAKFDTNSQWLSQQLSQLGILVRQHLSVADDLDHIVGSIRSAMENSRYIIITGGLGSTQDDLTRQALADAFEVEQVLHQPSLEQIESRFARMSRNMPPRNRLQAMFPRGSRPIPNSQGTAPGIFMEYEIGENDLKGQIFALPGVPTEMKSMFRDDVFEHLESSGNVIRQLRIHCFGMTESHTEELLEEITQRGHNPEVGITAHEATITLRLQAVGDSQATCDKMIAKTRDSIYEKLGQSIYGEEDVELEDVVLRILSESHKTLSVLELGTGGLLSQKFHQSGSGEDVFLGGTVLPCFSRRDRLSSGESFEERVEQTRRSFGSDLTLAIDGWDRNVVRQSEKATTVKILLRSSKTTEEFSASLVGVPQLERIRLAKIAMNFLRKHLKSREE